MPGWIRSTPVEAAFRAPLPAGSLPSRDATPNRHRLPLSARAGGREGDSGPCVYTRILLCAAGAAADHWTAAALLSQATQMRSPIIRTGAVSTGAAASPK